MRNLYQYPREQLEALDKALHVGCMMSNVCWAIGQGQEITSPNRESYKELQRQWDHYSAVLHRMRKDAKAALGEPQ